MFDVYCENEHGEKFLVEMQRGEQQFFKDRVFTGGIRGLRGEPQSLEDWKNILETAEKKAREEGILKGRMDVAHRMKSAGVPIDVIVQCSGLSEEEINQLEE